MSDSKNYISPELVVTIAAELRRARPELPAAAFTTDARTELQPLPLLARIGHVAAALRRAMPADVADAEGVLRGVKHRDGCGPSPRCCGRKPDIPVDLPDPCPRTDCRRGGVGGPCADVVTGPARRRR